MKKITLFLLSFILINSYIGFAQQSLNFSGTGETDCNSGYFTKYVAADKYANIDGTPYFNDEWISGVIKLKTGVELKIESCKYDVFEGKLVFMNEDKPLYFSSPQDIVGFKLGDSEFINLKQKKNNEFYECIYSSEPIKLLKEYTCVYIQGKETDGINPATKDKYAVDFEYYLKKGDAIEKFKLKEKPVLEMLNDKSGEIKAFIKDNKLNCKKEEDVIKIIEHYSTLI